MKKKEFVCHDCFELKKCKEPFISWVFFFIALVAVVALRAVNVVLDFNPILAKAFWYIGVGGFLVFFLYKFKNYSILQREITRTNLVDKLLSKKELTEYDKDVLGTIICQLSSKKDKVNYFFIFVFSALALALAIYTDFFRG